MGEPVRVLFVCTANICRSPTAEAADIHLAPKPGTDGALACAVMHILFRDGHAD